MQDTKNLKKKLKKYEQIISAYIVKGDGYSANYWTAQLDSIKSRLATRDKNRRFNSKQFRKAN